MGFFAGKKKPRFEEFYENRKKYVGKILPRIIRTTGTDGWEDIVQDAFVVILEKYDKIDDVELYFYKTVHYLLSNYRRSKKRQDISLDENPSYFPSAKIKVVFGEFEFNQAAIPQLQNIIDASLKRLPENDREIVNMMISTELKPEDISQVLQIGMTKYYKVINTFREVCKAEIQNV